MNYYFKYLALFFSMTLLIVSCSKDDSTASDADETQGTVTEVETTDNFPKTSFGNDPKCSFENATSFKAEFLQLFNAYRVEIGLNALVENATATHVALKHTTHMICEDDFNHSNFKETAEILQDEVKANSVSENLIYGYDTPQKALEGWLNSDGHRRNIENPSHTHTGFGVVEDSKGRFWATQLFYN